MGTSDSKTDLTLRRAAHAPLLTELWRISGHLEQERLSAPDRAPSRKLDSLKACPRLPPEVPGDAASSVVDAAYGLGFFARAALPELGLAARASSSLCAAHQK